MSRIDGYADRHPGTVSLLRHLDGGAAGELAYSMVDELPDGPELTAGLRKLLEAKDCFARARD